MLGPRARVWLLSRVRFTHAQVSFLQELEHEGPCELIQGKQLAMGAHISWLLIRSDFGIYQAK